MAKKVYMAPGQTDQEFPCFIPKWCKDIAFIHGWGKQKLFKGQLTDLQNINKNGVGEGGDPG